MSDPVTRFRHGTDWHGMAQEAGLHTLSGHYSVHTARRVRISSKSLMTTLMKPDMWVIVRQSVTNVSLCPRLLETY